MLGRQVSISHLAHAQLITAIADADGWYASWDADGQDEHLGGRRGGRIRE